MRALQAKVAASRADNAELRRANEELRRGLQHVGERAMDECAPPVPLRAHLMPFSRAIMNVVLLILPVDQDARALPRQIWIDFAPC